MRSFLRFFLLTLKVLNFTPLTQPTESDTRLQTCDSLRGAWGKGRALEKACQDRGELWGRGKSPPGR